MPRFSLVNESIIIDQRITDTESMSTTQEMEENEQERWLVIQEE